MKLKEKVSYSAVAAAVAMACGASFVSVVADAAIMATVGISTVSMSQQGNVLATSTNLQAFTFDVTIERDYAQSDAVRINLAGGTFSTSGALTNAVCTSTAGTATFGALSYDPTVANFRSTSTPNPVTGQVCRFTINVPSNSMATAGANVSVSFAATSASGLAVESSGSRVVGRVVDQFAASVGQAFNGVVNVNNNRLHFNADDGAGLGGNDDGITFTLTNTASLERSVSFTSAAFAITGDFNFLDDDGTAGCVSSDITTGFGQAAFAGATGTGTLSINTACSVLTYTETGALTTAARSIVVGKTAAASATAGTNEKVIAAPQTFTGTVTFSYTNGTLQASRSDGVSPGAFTLNGFSTVVPYMAYGTGRSRILWIANRSTQSGAATFAAVNDAGVACASSNFPAVNVAANAVTQLAAAFDTGIAACYGAAFAGRVAFTVTANVPNATAELYSAFNNNGDIAVVVNQSNGFGARN